MRDCALPRFCHRLSRVAPRRPQGCRSDNLESEAPNDEIPSIVSVARAGGDCNFGRSGHEAGPGRRGQIGRTSRLGKDRQSSRRRRRVNDLHDAGFRAGLPRSVPEKISPDQIQHGCRARLSARAAGHGRTASGEVPGRSLYHRKHHAGDGFSQSENTGPDQAVAGFAGSGE